MASSRSFRAPFFLVFGLASFAFVASLALSCGGGEAPAPAPPAPPVIDQARLAVFKPMPEVVPPAVGSDPLIDLGRMLYFEPRLSKGQTLSCNSCHDLAKYGVDGEITSDGHKGQKGDRNSPTVYNAAAHFVQFWDGRAKDVEEQAKGPILNPVEMAMPAEHVVIATIESMPEYVEAFAKAFPNQTSSITYDNLAKAIGAFERNLVTRSAWDAFLEGNASAMTPEEQAGLGTFLDAGCQACHYGPLLGGSSFQRMGAVKPYDRSSDPGRFKVTGEEADRGLFKVPSLRNVDKTAPYFHDGGVAALDAAIRDMAEFQLGRTLSADETAKIATFLKSLTGKLPTDYIQPPALPKSTAKTPKPDISD